MRAMKTSSSRNHERVLIALALLVVACSDDPASPDTGMQPAIGAPGTGGQPPGSMIPVGGGAAPGAMTPGQAPGQVPVVMTPPVTMGPGNMPAGGSGAAGMTAG